MARKRLKLILIILLQVVFSLSRPEILEIEDRHWNYINIVFSALHKLSCMQ